MSRVTRARSSWTSEAKKLKHEPQESLHVNGAMFACHACTSFKRHVVLFRVLGWHEHAAGLFCEADETEEEVA